jgi:glycosyltransferase involved in cell wall biosynthesis
MAKIGIDARLVTYRIGGIATYDRYLIDALRNNPHQYTIFQSRKAERPLVDHLKTANLWTPPHHRLEPYTLPLEIARHGLDIYHSTDFIPLRWGAKRQVITVHDLSFLVLPEHKDLASSRYYTAQIEWAVKTADHIISNSAATKRDMIELLRVPEEKITVTPLGIGTPFRTQEVLPRVAGLPDEYLLFVGTLEPRKNIPLLLEAYKQVKSAPPLVLAGRTGWLYEDIVKAIHQAQAEGFHVIWRDDIGDGELVSLYRHAQLLLMPSHYEGFGFPIVEAMACGTPVIASNISSLPEVVGDAGLLVSPSDLSAWVEAMEYGLFDPAWRAGAIARGLAQSARFTWENCAQITEQVYNQVIGL